MALAYRATPATFSAGSVTSYSVTKQTGTVAGDWIFIYVVNCTTSTVSISNATFSSVSDGSTVGVLFYRLADGTEPSSFTVAFGASTSYGVEGVIATVSGARSTLDPGTVTTPSATYGTTATAASITLAGSTDWVLCFACSNVSYPSVTVPSGFTQQALGTGGTSSGGHPLAYLADIHSIAAGATGSKVCTYPGNSWTSAVLAGLAPGGSTVAGATAAISMTAGIGTVTPAPVINPSAVTLPSLPAGYVVQVSDMNQLGAACTFLMTRPIARVHDATGGQTIAQAGTAITYTAVDFDTNSAWNASFPTRLTIPVQGYYRIRFGTQQSGQTSDACGHLVTGPHNPAGSGIDTKCWSGYARFVGLAGAAGILPDYCFVGDYVYVIGLPSVATTQAITDCGSYLCIELVSI